MVGDECLVCGVGYALQAVGREGGQLLLGCLPGRVVAGVCGHDDERLALEIGQGGRLLHRCRPLKELLQETADIASGEVIQCISDEAPPKPGSKTISGPRRM